MMDLMQSTVDLFSFFEKTPDLVCLAGKDGYFKKVNLSALKTFGFTEEELYGRKIDSFIHPDDLKETVKGHLNMFEDNILHNFQNRYITKSGDIVWLDWTSIYFSQKEIVFGLARNVTSIKVSELAALEQSARYKDLAAHFKSSIEKDRKELAYELHEELAQLAAGIKLQLETIPLHVPDLQPDVKHRLEAITTTARALINSLQRLAFSISPAMLEQYGLDDTLRLLGREFENLTGQEFTYTSSYTATALSYEMQTDFFRICQAALGNSMNHSKATEIFISIQEEDGYINLCIHDNGIGFDPTATTTGTGIINMRERTDSINGTLEILSAPGQGTSVYVRVKLS